MSTENLEALAKCKMWTDVYIPLAVYALVGIWLVFWASIEIWGLGS